MYVRKLPSGTWRVIVQHGGQRASATAPTRSAAERAGAELLLDMGGTPSTNRMTVGELVDLQLAEHTYRPTTLDDLTRVRKRLPDTFLDRRAADVEPVIIDALYRQLTRDGWSAHRVRKAHELLGAAFKLAKRRGWVRDIPTRDAAVPVAREREDTTPDAEDVQRILAAAPADLDLFLWLAATTGARRGELCALRWEDVDERERVVRIRRAASYTPASGLVVGDVKTGQKGRRGLPLDADTLERFAAHRTRQQHDGVPIITPWVFTNDHVTCWRPDYVTSRFVDLRNSLGLHHVRLQDLRHYVASELVGFTDARTAADHLGHANPTMTLNRYASSLDDRRRAAADHLTKRAGGGA